MVEAKVEKLELCLAGTMDGKALEAASALAERAGIDMLDDHDQFLADLQQTLVDFADEAAEAALAALPIPDDDETASIVSAVEEWVNCLGGDATLEQIVAMTADTIKRARSPAPSPAPEVERMREALEAFAEPRNWVVKGRFDPHSGNFDATTFARAALSSAPADGGAK